MGLFQEQKFIYCLMQQFGFEEGWNLPYFPSTSLLLP